MVERWWLLLLLLLRRRWLYGLGWRLLLLLLWWLLLLLRLLLALLLRKGLLGLHLGLVLSLELLLLVRLSAALRHNKLFKLKQVALVDGLDLASDRGYLRGREPEGVGDVWPAIVLHDVPVAAKFLYRLEEMHQVHRPVARHGVHI